MGEVDLLKVGHPSKIDDALIVENIVDEWNRVVTSVENNTIRFCKKIEETLKLLPKSSAREIMIKVSKHPKLKRGISVHRAWAGLRLLRNRPDIIEYDESTPEQKKDMEQPVLKEDGNVNFEFYIEMYKHKLDEGVRGALEHQAKGEGWSYRRLIKEIRSVKDKVALTTEDEKALKSIILRDIIGLLKGLNLDLLKEVKQELFNKLKFKKEIGK